MLRISAPKDNLLSENGKSIWESLNFAEKLYCKYCFLQSTAISTVFVGVVSAYLVNIFTNIIGITFEGTFHIVVYLINTILSVIMFICVVRLYSIHVDSKEISDATQGMKSHHTTLELKFFRENRLKIRANLRILFICVCFLLVTLTICIIINNLDLTVSPTCPSAVPSGEPNPEIP